MHPLGVLGILLFNRIGGNSPMKVALVGGDFFFFLLLPLLQFGWLPAVPAALAFTIFLPSPFLSLGALHALRFLCFLYSLPSMLDEML